MSLSFEYYLLIPSENKILFFPILLKMTLKTASIKIYKNVFFNASFRAELELRA